MRHTLLDDDSTACADLDEQFGRQECTTRLNAHALEGLAPEELAGAIWVSHPEPEEGAQDEPSEGEQEGDESQQPQSAEGEMSAEEAERMLDGLEEQELENLRNQALQQLPARSRTTEEDW